MIKNTMAKIAATSIAFLCASIFPLRIKYQPIATIIALSTINVVLIVGKIGNEYSIVTSSLLLLKSLSFRKIYFYVSFIILVEKPIFFNNYKYSHMNFCEQFHCLTFCSINKPLIDFDVRGYVQDFYSTGYGR